MVNWITVSSSSGNSGSTVVTVTASSYTELTARTTSLTVRTVNSNLSANVNITQEPKEIITVTVSPTSISAPVSGGTYTFNIASNGAWSITYPSWLQVSQTSGTGNATITVTIPENESYSALTGNIVVSTADNTATVSVSQAAEEEPSRISVSPTTIQNISSGGSAYTLTVSSNTGWTIDGPSWVRYSTLRGSGDTTVNITVVPNSSSARTDNIIFTTTDSAATATVSLSQDAYSEQPTGSTGEYLTFEISSPGNIVWLANKSASTLTIEYSKNDGEWTQITATTGGTNISVVSGDIVKFRGDNATYETFPAYEYYNCFRGTSCGFRLYGNIMSLINSSNFSGLTTFQTIQTFQYLFSGCTGLTDASELVLPATALTSGCYWGMFRGCKSLTTAPELPATTLAGQCYSYMFAGCSSLTVPLNYLPATASTSGCYNCMFSGCTSLTTVPNLPAATIEGECYLQMFAGCTSLTTVPLNYLPETTLAEGCYRGMFRGCTSLTTAPALPATTLTNSCYQGMFYGCTSLTTAPVLPATTLVYQCYQQMFQGCSNLQYVECLATDNSAGYCTLQWLSLVSSSGTFVKNPSMTSWTTGYNGIPTGWTVQDAS